MKPTECIVPFLSADIRFTEDQYFQKPAIKKDFRLLYILNVLEQRHKASKKNVKDTFLDTSNFTKMAIQVRLKLDPIDENIFWDLYWKDGESLEFIKYQNKLIKDLDLVNNEYFNSPI